MNQQEKEAKRLQVSRTGLKKRRLNELVYFQACEDHGKLTKEYAERHQLHKTLTELTRKAFESKSNYPQLFIADEIRKNLSLPPSNEELAELRKKVNRFQKLLEQLKDRSAPKGSKADDEEEIFMQYLVKHRHKEFMIEAVKNAYCIQSPNPLKFISEMIQNQPDHKILVRRETEELEKRVQIYTNIIQVLIKENPMSLKEIEEFSTKTVLQEMKKDP